MVEIILGLELWSKWLLASTVLYGLLYGVKNLMVKVQGIVIRRTVVQSLLGSVFDFYFYISVIYYSVFVFKVFG